MVKLANIKHVFFDLDHTLWDFDKNSALTFQKIFNLNNLEIETQKFLDIYIPINLNYWKLYREEKIDQQSLRLNRLKDAFNVLEFEVSEHVINKLSLDYIENLTTFSHLFEGTIDLLEYLKQHYTLHIITNGFEEAQARKMANSQITSYFKTITNSEMAGVKKPNIKIFRYALKKAEATAANSVMIGDNFEADIEGAENAGIDTIFFNYHKEPPRSNLKTVETLIEIRNYL